MLIALGISGGIAAYKTCEIVRGLDKAGADVQVILTRHAAEFITPLTLQTLSRRRVLSEPFELADTRTIRHIDLTREIDAFVVAPATANILAKFAHGIADDFLSTFFLAVTAPVIVAPAMNTRMWLHPATRENLERLKSRGVEIVEPASGWLAEGEVGWGRMEEPEAIVETALRAARRTTELEGRRVVVTAGPTSEAIDPVRYLTNRSSGRMGYALAEACARRGAAVTLISGASGLAAPFGVNCVSVVTSAEMRDAVLTARAGADCVFMAAAVSDYLPRAAASKIKKSGEPLTLTFDEGPDILAEMGRDRDERVLVGFAAETESLFSRAREKLKRKNLDFIVANDVGRGDIGFDSTENAVSVIDRRGEVVEIPKASKQQVAEAILDRVLPAITAD